MTDETTPKEPLSDAEEAAIATEFAKVWHVLKAADTDLQAHKNAIAAFLKGHPELAEFLDAHLVSARQSPALRVKMNQKYEPVLGTSLRAIPDGLAASIRETLESLEKLA